MKSLRIRILEILGPIIQNIRLFLLTLKGYKNISKRVIIERGVNLDRVYPEDIHIGDGCLIASKATILCHEHVYRDEQNPELPLRKKVLIGRRCFIGVGAFILPGVNIGDDCIIGAGTVVTKDIPAGSLAVGVPAKVIKSGLKLNESAILIS
jgi:acetyltransferase-like isoleucine patch superfamily enzyme